MSMQYALWLATCALLPLAHAHPNYWIHNDGQSISKTCTDGPSLGKQYGGHPTVVSDSSTTFVVKVNGEAVTGACPGVKHAVEVQFPEKRQGLLRASAGAFVAPYQGESNKGCVNRQVLIDTESDEGTKQDWATSLTLPCSASGSVQLWLTSTSGADQNLQTTSTTLKVDDACAAASCVGMNRAVRAGGLTTFREHAAAGVARVNLAEGTSTDGASGGASESPSTVRWVRAHGVLMSVTWMLLLPLGTLLPAHRWALGGARLGSRQLWFVLHLAFQLLGIALFIAGFVIAFVTFPDGPLPGGACGTTHQVLGIIVIGMMLIQVVVAFIRPHVEAGTRRTLWNHFHHNLGRLTILASWVVIYLGIYIFHVDEGYKESLAAWMAPVASVNGLVVIVGLLLLIYRMRANKHHALHAPSNRSSDAGVVMTSPLPPQTAGGGGHSDACQPPLLLTKRHSSSDPPAR